MVKDGKGSFQKKDNAVQHGAYSRVIFFHCRPTFGTLKRPKSSRG
jgi:hypothetical protein